MAGTCPSCQQRLPENARFCTNCGAMAVSEQLGVATNPAVQGIAICGTCGLVAPREHRFCSVCDAPLGPKCVPAPAVPNGLHWAAVSVRFECRACRQLSPLNHLDIDGQVKCLHCGVEQRFDVSRWQGVLSFADAAATSVSPKAHARRVAEGFGALGQSAAFATRNVESLEVRAGAGHPLCERCSVPLNVSNVAAGTLTVSCPQCNVQRSYFSPPQAFAQFPSLRGAVCAEQEVGRRDVKTEVDQGGSVVVRCGNCSGPLQIPEGRTVVHCTYCGVACRLTPEALWRMGSKSLRADWWWLLFADQEPAPNLGEVPWERAVNERILSVQVRPQHAQPRAAQKGSGCGVFLAMFVALPVIGGVVYFASRGSLGSGAAELLDSAFWNGVRRPLAYDVNGDGILDIVGSVRTVTPEDTIRLAAFDGKTGKSLWRSGVVGTYTKAGMSELAVVNDTLLLPQDGGKLRSFKIGDGTPGFNIRLNENIERLCDAQKPAAVIVETKDKQQHTLSLANGAIEKVAAASVCRPLRASKPVSTFHGVFSENAPVLRDKVPGISSDKTLEVEGATALLAVGHKDPGTRVPKLAAFRRSTGGKRDQAALPEVLWVSDVPGVDALTVREGDLDERNLSISGDAVVALYELKDAAHQFRLTALSFATGKRLWDSPIEDDSPFSGLVATPTHVFVSRWHGLFAFDIHSGQLAYKIR